jgi:hypothetical protein
MSRPPLHASVIRTMGGGFVRVMDALSRGASPPGMIDILHTRDSHLRRRFTMIASYNGRAGRWSAPGLVVSLTLCGVALTGAVRGQSAPESQQQATPAATSQAPAAEAKPDIPAGYEKLSEKAIEEKLWNDKYAKQIYMVNGAEANRNQVDEAYLKELTQLKKALGIKPEPAPAPDGPVEDEDVDKAVLAQLDRPLPEVSFDGAPLSDVVDFLRDLSGTNIVAEWGPLAAAGIDRNTQVSVRLMNVKFGRVLDRVLSSASGGSVPVGYSIEDNILRISTREDLERNTAIRAYDVRDIVPNEMPMQELTKMITEAVAPDSWQASGGSVGTVHASKHKLIVKQTPMNHRQVREVLKMLREDPTRVPEATDAASAAQALPPGYPQRPAGVGQ